MVGVKGGGVVVKGIPLVDAAASAASPAGQFTLARELPLKGFRLDIM